MLQKPMVNLESLHANKPAETLMQTVPDRFSRITDLNIIFVCRLVTPAGKKYYGPIDQKDPYGPTLHRLKSVPRISGKCNQTQDQTKQLLNDPLSRKILVSGTINHP
jgi:hypothetical protein